MGWLSPSPSSGEIHQTYSYSDWLNRDSQMALPVHFLFLAGSAEDRKLIEPGGLVNTDDLSKAFCE